jgi:hypothetical protein
MFNHLGDFKSYLKTSGVLKIADIRLIPLTSVLFKIVQNMLTCAIKQCVGGVSGFSYTHLGFL